MTHTHFTLPSDPNADANADSLPYPSLLHIVQFLNKQAKDDKQRYDIGCVTNKFGERLVIYLTEHDLNVMNGPHLQNVKCECCHLVVPDWAFGEYFLKRDSEGTYLVVIHKICLGCWRYTILNPRFDYVESEDTPPPQCTCPPGSMACDGARTGCTLHNVVFKRPVPAGIKAHERPLLHQEVAWRRSCEIEALCEAKKTAKTDEEYAALSKRLEEVFESGDKARAYAAKVKGVSNGSVTEFNHLLANYLNDMLAGLSQEISGRSRGAFNNNAWAAPSI
ncbi:hypothetical protein R3P38DRAFT_2804802 [Favolaschia claudopus]|uniref:Uncharacterized protein n=1 Tax=Favolaschia claudopus TaxID=2862362 RepID=A0AAV9ZNR3_9AGAR